MALPVYSLFFAPIKKMNKRIVVVCFILSLFLLSCEKEEISIVKPIRVGIPALSGNPDDLFIEHKVEVEGKEIVNYSLEYSCSNKHARWIAFSFYDLTAVKKVNRPDVDPWADDPQVPANCRSDRDDFRGFDRGHLCASNDRVYSLEANAQTFYYSNVSPQYGTFNRGIWQKLESMVQNWGRNPNLRDTLYVVKGGTISSDKINGYTDRGPNRIPVPKYYYMALLRVKSGVYTSIAFLLEHKTNYGTYKMSDFAVSIDSLESFTGIDFFCALPDRVEGAVEQSWEKLTWPGLE